MENQLPATVRPDLRRLCEGDFTPVRLPTAKKKRMLTIMYGPPR